MTRFVDSFHYEYNAIAKDPPDRDAWIEQNKREIFLWRFASRNLQKDYEDAVIPANSGTMTFSQTVTEFKNIIVPLEIIPVPIINSISYTRNPMKVFIHLSIK